MKTPEAQYATPELREWDEHLALGLKDEKRGFTFDMEEEPERAHLAHFPRLAAAIRFLDEQVKPVYERADKDAIAHQKKHRMLSRVAILGGGFAIGFAILQLAIAEHRPSWRGMVAALEGVAVLAGVTAVGFGLWAKSDDQWFIQRHIAERLRMLKFQALGRAEFWAGQAEAWERWVCAQVAEIRAITSIAEVEAWAAGGEAEPDEPSAPACSDGDANTAATAIYYRRKRVDFQAAYFKRQSRKLARESGWLHRVGLPLFFASIVAVIVHFAADFAGGRVGADGRHAWEMVGVCALSLAALLPVLSFGVRAWIGAFERARSAHLFHAKHRALMKSCADLSHDEADCAATMHHIAHVEYFLEHEHREWLRLLLDAEWFL